MASNHDDKYTASTSGDVLWINSGTKCVIRICGMSKLRGMRSVNAIVSKPIDEMVDVTIDNELLDKGDAHE